MNKPRFIIYMPYFSPLSGGVVALATLCEILNKMGYEAWVTSKVNSPKFSAPFLTERIYIDYLINKENYFVIYPEKIPGNPLEAKNVIRWILFTPDEAAGEGLTYSDSDFIFKHSSFYAVNPRYSTDGLLYVSDVERNLDLFQNRNLDREGSCFIVKKGGNRKIEHNLCDSVCIDNLSLQEIAIVFNKTNIFYSYDPVCFYSILAAICGCDSIVIPHPDISKEEFISGYPGWKYGVGFGFDDREWSTKTKHLTLKQMMEVEKDTITQIEEMIKIITTKKK